MTPHCPRCGMTAGVTVVSRTASFDIWCACCQQKFTVRLDAPVREPEPDVVGVAE